MNNKSRAVSVDPGTMFFQSAQMIGDSIEYKDIRNAFIQLPANEQTQQALANNNWQYILDSEQKKYYIIGQDALKMAKMFPNIQLRRPMQDGVLNKGEQKKMMVMAQLIERCIGKAGTQLDTVTTCISSPSVDNAVDSSYHSLRLQGMFKRLGWNVNVIQEGHAVVLSQNPTMKQADGTVSKYSGLGISFGGGKTNAVLSYKGKQILGLSATRGGDWIDRKVAQATDSPISQVIGAKQKLLDFNKIDYNNDVLFALDAYYGELLKYVFQHFSKKFKQVKSQFPGAIQIVIAGGTSMPKGFVKKVQKILSEMTLPFQIASVRHAEDPRHAVARGCATHAIVSQRKKVRQLQQKRKQQQAKRLQEAKNQVAPKADIASNINALDQL